MDLLSVKTTDGKTAKINAYVRMLSDKLRREETERWTEDSKDLIVVDLPTETIKLVIGLKLLLTFLFSSCILHKFFKT